MREPVPCFVLISLHIDALSVFLACLEDVVIVPSIPSHVPRLQSLSFCGSVPGLFSVFLIWDYSVLIPSACVFRHAVNYE